MNTRRRQVLVHSAAAAVIGTATWEKAMMGWMDNMYFGSTMGAMGLVWVLAIAALIKFLLKK